MVPQLFLEVAQYYPQYDSSPSEHMTSTVGDKNSFNNYTLSFRTYNDAVLSNVDI